MEWGEQFPLCGQPLALQSCVDGSGAAGAQDVLEERGAVCGTAVYGGVVVSDVSERFERQCDGLCVVVDPADC